jgi:hypothetical protein
LNDAVADRAESIDAELHDQDLRTRDGEAGKRAVICPETRRSPPGVVAGFDLLSDRLTRR